MERERQALAAQMPLKQKLPQGVAEVFPDHLVPAVLLLVQEAPRLSQGILGQEAPAVTVEKQTQVAHHPLLPRQEQQGQTQYHPALVMASEEPVEPLRAALDRQE